MKRLVKAVLMTVRKLAYRCNRIKLYYWADHYLYDLRTVTVMPNIYYRFLFRASMRLAESSRYRRLADKAIHTIPIHVRFDVA